ncbi:MAG TPA: SLC13 family permease [Vicinamibacterales bacterium]|nr:SLC13 family permease [Vicinamibacterales bacterium]
MLASLSLAALAIAMIVSCTTQLNVGVLALALAWIVGVYLGGMKLDDVLAGFPAQLFLTLAGVTLLFTQSQLNGTLDRIAQRAVRLCRGNAGLIPVMFFMLGCGIASVGPGNVSTAAMLGPMAMSVAARAAIPPFLMAIMVGNGAQSGSLSPFAPTGLIVNPAMEKIGLGGHELWTYWTNLAAHAMVAFGGYLLLGGWKLFKSTYAGESAATGSDAQHFEPRHWITIVTILGVLAAVLFARANIGMAAFAGAVLLAALRVADHEQAIKRMPWTPILMVSGVSVLVSLLEKTGGLDLFTRLLAGFSTPATLTGFMAFVTGVISVYSSTSGVVLPTFLPTVPGLVERLSLPGMTPIDPLAIASSMNVGAHLVDMSPLSTTGAVCIAAIADPAQVRPTYNKLLAWGLSMTVVGALGCYLFF